MSRRIRRIFMVGTIAVLALLPALPSGSATHKVTICHRTGSGKFVLIKVSQRALKAHVRHHDGDMLPTMSDGEPRCELAVLEITKTASTTVGGPDQDTFRAGEIFYIRVRVTNIGSVTANDAAYRDVYTPAQTFPDAFGRIYFACGVQGFTPGPLSWFASQGIPPINTADPDASLPPGASFWCDLGYSQKVPESCGTWTDTATVTWSNLGSAQTTKTIRVLCP